MTILNWNSAYSVGNPQLDEHHRKLFNLINTMHDNMKSQNGTEDLPKLLDELISYTQYHFSAEEKLMSMHGYPELNEHKIEHDKLIKQALEYKGSLGKGHDLTISINMLNTLTNWLTNHVATMDKKYKGHI